MRAMNYDDWKTTPPAEPTDAQIEEAMEAIIGRLSALDLLTLPDVQLVMTRVYAKYLADFAAAEVLDAEEAVGEFFFGVSAEEVISAHPEVRAVAQEALLQEAIDEAAG
jgi:hypothetical protein